MLKHSGGYVKSTIPGDIKKHNSVGIGIKPRPCNKLRPTDMTPIKMK